MGETPLDLLDVSENPPENPQVASPVDPLLPDPTPADITDEVTKPIYEEKWAKNIVDIVSQMERADQFVRESLEKKWRKQMCYWDNLQYIWWSDFARDWRTAEQAKEENPTADIDPALYAKVVNIYRAHGEVIIAAMSAATPTVPFFPDDADNASDVSTAKAYTKIGELIQKHNFAELIFMKALYILYNQGVVFGYNEYRKDPKFGIKQEPDSKPHQVTTREHYCASCGMGFGSEEIAAHPLDNLPPAEDQPMPPQQMDQMTGVPPGSFGSPGMDQGIGMDQGLPPPTNLPSCPNCGYQGMPESEDYNEIFPRIVGYTDTPEGRECLEVYGPLNVKIPGWATKEEDIPYLILETDEHYAKLQNIYPEIADVIQPGGFDTFDRSVRVPSYVAADMPIDLITTKRVWLQPWAFNILGVGNRDEDIQELKTMFPSGCYAVILNKDIVAEAVQDYMFDHWTFTQYPLAETIHATSIGEAVVPIQDMTNESYNLTLEGIEFGIPEIFADPDVLNFDAYDKSEARPGQISPAKAPSGRSLGEGFYEVKSSSISQEIDRFMLRLEREGQFVSGALPTVFGGAIQGGTGTAREYEMSRSQALQRLQITWKVVKTWWAQMLSKSVRSFANHMDEDKKYVEQRGSSFVNVWIKKADMGGKVGEVEPDVNESFPIGWAQKRDLIMQLIQYNNDDIMTVIRHPENASLVAAIIGVPDLYIPGDDDRNKQLAEIAELILEQPTEQPPQMVPGPEGPMPAIGPNGQPAQPQMQSSIPIEPELDNNEVEAETCKAWLKSEVGMFYKKTQPQAYLNVLLHMKEHLHQAQMDQMRNMMMQGQAGPPPGPDKQDTKGN